MAQTPAYGVPASVEVVLSQGFSEGIGLEYEVNLLPDERKEEITPRSQDLAATISDFFSSLVETDGRYFFSGVLNDWPALTSLEVILLKNGPDVLWSSEGEGKASTGALEPPQVAGELLFVIVRAPDFTATSYCKGNPGFVFWADASIDGRVHAFYPGTQGLKCAREDEHKDSVAVRVHLYGHRYGKPKETIRDRFTYHSGLLIEWSHGEFCTVAELAYLNGIGGYRGNSNYLYDSFREEENSLYGLMPESMKLPWTPSRSEIRLFDMPWKGIKDADAFFRSHEGGNGRFLQSFITKTAAVTLPNATRATIYAGLLNYIAGDPSYSEFSGLLLAGNNCQTFAADLHSYLTQSKKVKPVTRVIGSFYYNRASLFLGNAHMIMDT